MDKEQDRTYENYPLGIVFVSDLLSLAIYGIGAYVMFRLGAGWAAAYLLYVVLLEYMVLKKSCVNCCYYGKTCAFGRGRLCSLLFRRGDAHRFVSREVTWKDIAPDFLVSLIPVIVAAYLMMTQGFDWLLLALLLSMLLLGFAGNALVRGRLACKFCRQRIIGCPAEQLFNKSKK